ncbi:MAG: SDR family oxidoreductase [Candidatus Levybacteria bacterium]|nr:SDR family oxidoreductase [Candidatus Levybacteria bacterium]
MKILGTGLSGMVGSRIVELLKDQYEFENLSISSGFDITQKKIIEDKIIFSDSPIVLHLASKADVDGCENDKEQGSNGEAWKINVDGTQNIADACKKSGKKLIYFSTDFVFNGEKEDGYNEEDTPDPINWYAKTKYEGEKLLMGMNQSLILRIAFPYRTRFDRKTDFVRAVLNKLKQNVPIYAVYDQIITPTFIDDIVQALDFIIKNKISGKYHLVGSQSISPYESALLIANVLNLDKSLINKITREEYFKNKAKRPFHLRIKNDKIGKLGIKMKTFEEGLIEIKKQLENL